MRDAIELTLRAIESRARLYRNIVVIVSLSIVGAPIVALVSWSWWPLAWLAVLPVVVATYLALDTSLVRRWNRRVTAVCLAQGIPLAEFAKTVGSIRTLPQGTVHGMLATLRPAAATQASSPRTPRR
jgi:hypothetical protein